MSCLVEPLAASLACESQPVVFCVALFVVAGACMGVCCLRYQSMILVTKGGLRERYVVEVSLQEGQLGVDLTADLVICEVHNGPVKQASSKSSTQPVGRGDRIVMVNGRPVSTLSDLQLVLTDCSSAKLVLHRGQEKAVVRSPASPQSPPVILSRHGPDKNVARWEQVKRDAQLALSKPQPPRHDDHERNAQGWGPMGTHEAPQNWAQAVDMGNFQPPPPSYPPGPPSWEGHPAGGGAAALRYANPEYADPEYGSYNPANPGPGDGFAVGPDGYSGYNPANPGPGAGFAVGPDGYSGYSPANPGPGAVGPAGYGYNPASAGPCNGSAVGPDGYSGYNPANPGPGAGFVVGPDGYSGYNPGNLGPGAGFAVGPDGYAAADVRQLAGAQAMGQSTPAGEAMSLGGPMPALSDGAPPPDSTLAHNPVAESGPQPAKPGRRKNK